MNKLRATDGVNFYAYEKETGVLVCFEMRHGDSTSSIRFDLSRVESVELALLLLKQVHISKTVSEFSVGENLE